MPAAAAKGPSALQHFTSCPSQEKRRILERGRSKCLLQQGKVQVLFITSHHAHLMRKAGSSRGVAANACCSKDSGRGLQAITEGSSQAKRRILERASSKRAPRDSPWHLLATRPPHPQQEKQRPILERGRSKRAARDTRPKSASPQQLPCTSAIPRNPREGSLQTRSARVTWHLLATRPPHPQQEKKSPILERDRATEAVQERGSIFL